MSALDTVIEFGCFSGLNRNLSETEGMSLGSLGGYGGDIDGINWVKCIQYLGVYVRIDCEECYYINNILQQFQK